MSVRVRPARPGEAERLAEVQCTSALAGYAGIFPPEAPLPTPADLVPAWASALADPRAVVLVAEAVQDGGDGGAEVVGTVLVRPDPSVPAGWLLAKLYVHPSVWAAGVGARLHEAAVAELVAMGARRVDLWVLEANERARTMYARRGWRLVPGRRVVRPGSEVVEVMYELDLTARVAGPGR